MAGRRQATQAAELTWADVPARQIKMLGSLPVIFSFCTRLGIGQVIDDLVPIRDAAAVTAGQAVEAMICNRLTSPAPLVRVGDWARTWAVPEVLGIPAVALNDDKLGRTLDAIAPHLDQITSAVAVRAISAFDIDISQLHWDMTSFSLHGACDQADEDYPAPRYGHPKDRRPDLLQVQAGIAAAGDGGIPVYARAYDGGAAEVSQVTGAMTELKKIAGARTFLLIGDSKLISCDNVAAITGAGCTFLAPASKTYVKAAELAACDLGKATEAGYVAGRDRHKKNSNPGQLGRWYVLQDDQPSGIRNSRRKSDPPITLRRIFVHSTARAGAALTSRAKSSPVPKTTWAAWSPAWAAGFTQASRRPPAGSSRSPATARPAPTCATPSAPPRPAAPRAAAPARRPVPRPLAPARRVDPARRTPGRAAAAADPANPPSPGGSTRTRSTLKPPPTAGTRC